MRRKAILLEIAPNRSPAQELKRIAVELVHAVAVCLDRRSPTDIHEARKRLKELRAVLRLIETGWREASAIRQQLRDVGRHLAPSREAVALVDALESLDHTDDAEHRFRENLRAIINGIAETTVLDIDYIASATSSAQSRLEGWNAGAAPVDLHSPLITVYRSARRRMRSAVRTRSAAAFHDWRKRTKEHWYEVRLVAGLCSDRLRTRQEALLRLSRLLGDHHDLAMLRNVALRYGDLLGPVSALRFWSGITTKMHGLEEETVMLGASLFMEKPRQWFRAAGEIQLTRTD